MATRFELSLLPQVHFYKTETHLGPVALKLLSLPKHLSKLLVAKKFLNGVCFFKQLLKQQFCATKII